MPRFQNLYCSTWSRVVLKLTQIKEYTSYFISYRWGWLSLTEGGVNPDFEWSWRGGRGGGAVSLRRFWSLMETLSWDAYEGSGPRELLPISKYRYVPSPNCQNILISVPYEHFRALSFEGNGLKTVKNSKNSWFGEICNIADHLPQWCENFGQMFWLFHSVLWWHWTVWYFLGTSEHP